MMDALRQECTDCGFIYDPADYNGAALLDLGDWECPNCGAGVDKFDIAPEPSIFDDGDEDDVAEEAESPDQVADTRGATAVRAKVLEVTRAERAVQDLARMWDDKELVLRPDWQRDYVWSNKQASQLIESLFLRLPIPLIYLFQEDGKLIVVDGQQRLTALIQFVRNKHFDPLKSGDVYLTGLEQLTELNKKRFEDLSDADQLFIRNQVLSTVQMSSDVNPDLKLEVFRRLNTGSVKLNDQELRNAAYRGAYNNELKKWALTPEFLEIFGFAKHGHKRMIDVELVLRFCAWYNSGFHMFKTKRLSEFFDREMENGKNYKDRELRALGKRFKDAIHLAYSGFGADRAFRRYREGSSGAGIFDAKANKAIYDVVMYSFARYPKAHIWPHLEALRESLYDLMASDPKFQDAIGGSTSDAARINYRFTTWMARFEEIVGDDPQKRTFTRDVKRKLFQRNPTCQLCKQEIYDMDDSEVHHVEEYWRGGKTIPENAALTHRFCNRSHGGGKK